MRSVGFRVTVAMLAVVGSVFVHQRFLPAQESAPASTGAPVQALTADQQAVLETLRQIAHAQVKRDVAAFGRLTADEFLHFGPDGSLTNKQEWLRILEDEPPRLVTPPEPLDVPVTLKPGTVVRVVGTTAVVVEAPAPTVKDQPTRVVTVLVNQNGTWRQLLVNRSVKERTTEP